MLYALYILAFPLGALISTHVRFRHKREYFWVEYCLFFIPILISAYFLYLQHGVRVVLYFTGGGIVGPFLEAMIGYAYLRATGRHLWLYGKTAIFNRTTSLLSGPYWGAAVLATWALSKLIAG